MSSAAAVLAGGVAPDCLRDTPDCVNAQASKQPLLFMLAKRWPSLLNQAIIFDVPARLNPGLRWASTNGMWVFGVRTRRELLAAIRRYSLKEVAGRITCPTLILHGERDHCIPAQQVAAFYEALNCPKALRMFNADDGAEEHCQIGNLSRMHQVAFDWLDEVFKVVEQSESQMIDTPLAYAAKGLEALHV